MSWQPQFSDEILIKAASELAEQRRREEALPTGPSGDIYQGMPMANEIFDDKIAAAEARSEAKLERMLGEMRTGFADIRGEIRAVSTRVEAVERSTSGIKSTIVITAVGAVALVVAILAYAGDSLTKGMSYRDVIAAETARQLSSSEERLKASFSSTLGEVLKAMAAKPPAPAGGQPPPQELPKQ